MQHLRGTLYWPELDGVILFLETSEERPDPERVDGILMGYENMGAFAGPRGLLFGRPFDYTPEEREQLHEVILEHTRGITSRSSPNGLRAHLACVHFAGQLPRYYRREALRDRRGRGPLIPHRTLYFLRRQLVNQRGGSG